MTETIYAGMAGDTDEGRFVISGLFRRTDGGGWERIDGSFDGPPEVRAILTDPGRPERVADRLRERDLPQRRSRRKLAPA